MPDVVAYFEIINFFYDFIRWTSTLTLWDLLSITIFTVAIDLLRNVCKCTVLALNAISSHFKPLKLDTLTNPKISILIPAHNESAAIRKTILSVLENNYSNKEIIVIDDHSTDDTYQQALPFHENSQIKLVQRLEGKGSKSAAINYGILFATGDYLMVMDGDTLLERTALSEVAKHVTLPEIISVSGNVRILSGDGGKTNLITKCQSYEYLIAFELGRRYNALLNMLIIIPGAFGVFSKEAAKKVGLYDKDTVGEDFDLTIKLLKLEGKVEFVSKAIAWTYCPNNWKAWTRQRIRWAHGQMSTLIKHRDIETSRTFRHSFIFAIYDMIFMDIVLLFVRMAGIVWLVFNFTDSIVFVYILVYLLYFVNEFIVILTATAFSPEKKDLKYIYLVPFIVSFYRPYYTYVRFYAYMKRLLNRETKW